MIIKLICNDDIGVCNEMTVNFREELTGYEVAMTLWRAMILMGFHPNTATESFREVAEEIDPLPLIDDIEDTNDND